MRLSRKFVGVREFAETELRGSIVGHLNWPMPDGVSERRPQRLDAWAAEDGVPLEVLVSLLSGYSLAEQRVPRLGNMLLKASRRGTLSLAVQAQESGRLFGFYKNVLMFFYLR